jgi:hypothetical protein
LAEFQKTSFLLLPPTLEHDAEAFPPILMKSLLAGKKKLGKFWVFITPFALKVFNIKVHDERKQKLLVFFFVGERGYKAIKRIEVHSATKH